MMKQIAVYGKGGIGKSTIVANVGAALATMGAKVLVVGCDPKADTIRTLIDGRRVKTVLDSLREAQREGIELNVDRIVTRGYRGILCVESGGPEPGVGCAGRGIISAMEVLQQSSLFKANDMDVVLYDVLGDVVCGGFAMPIRMGLARQIYAVTSGEFMAVYAANNICRGILRYATSGGGRFSALICNARNVANEAQYIQDFSDQLKVRLACTIPRDGVVQDAEAHGKTVVEYAPDSALAARFGQLARMMLENEEAVVPNPLSEEDLESLFLRYR